MNVTRIFPKKRGIGYTRKASSKRKGVRRRMFTEYRESMNKNRQKIVKAMKEAEEKE